MGPARPANADRSDVPALTERHLEPPAQSKTGRHHHWLMLGVAVVVVLLSCLLEVRGDGRVFFRAAPHVVLPETCASKVMFDAECAGCGLTRSFIHLAAFRWRESWGIHRAGWIVAIIVLGQIPYRILRIRDGRPRPAWTLWVSAAAITALFAHWILDSLGI